MTTYDVVLFGATGFTGRRTAVELAKRKGAARVALAGRDRAKLDALNAELGGGFGVVVGDARDRAAMDALAATTKVVATTAGPFAQYGDALIAACVARGVDTCDLNGEPQWMKRVVDAHHDEAKKTGARIVHCCGFDSIPSDLGVHVLQRHAQATHGAPATRVTFAMRRIRGALSGGTIASGFGSAEEASRDRAARKALVDPYALVPDDARGPDRTDVVTPGWDDDVGAWRAPFMMSFINAKIVRRTNWLSGFRYGRDFSYRELSAFRRGPKGALRAVGTTAALAAASAVQTRASLRRLAGRFVTPPGEGPSDEAIARGLYDAEVVGFGTSSSGAPFTVRARSAGEGDPGYGATARMLAEAALCLALDEKTTGGGVLTPAYAMGDALVQRLRAVRIVLDVLS